MSLNGRKVVVTGGSRGLGLGLVEALVARDPHALELRKFERLQDGRLSLIYGIG